MSKKIDMIGQVIGMLEVIESAGTNKEGKALWRCRCNACGNDNYIATGKQLRRKSILKTCGCLQGKKKDISGQRFGKLTAIERIGSKDDYHSIWKCKCDCGNYKNIAIQYLMNGHTKSCGCSSVLKGEDNPHSTHLMSNSRLYHVYMGIKHRCYNPNDTNYEYYGGKGIKMCQEWLDDYMNFFTWAIQNGYDENADYGQCTIDRIDPNKDYCPENCRWITLALQAQNKTDTLRYEINGITKSLSEWCSEYKISYSIVYQRLYNGIGIVDALTYPVQDSPTKYRIPRQ